MSLDAVAAIAAGAPPMAQIVEPSLNAAQGTQSLPGGMAAANAGFGDMVTQGLEQVNQQLMTNQVDLQKLATGNVQNLHEIMMHLEESRISFQLVMQVRNRLLDTYQDVMKMQL